jgi:hypothetical protein
MSIVLVTASGEQHGLIRTVANSVPDTGFKHMEPKWREQAKKMREEDHKTVKARYLNKIGNHERLTKPYCRWAGDPIHTYHLIPGYVYELPMGFVNEINNKKDIQRSDRVDVDTDKISTKDSEVEGVHQLVPVSF